jgi:hypothetical protein
VALTKADDLRDVDERTVIRDQKNHVGRLTDHRSLITVQFREAGL